MTRAIVWCGTLALGLHAAAGLAQSLPAAQAAGDAEAGWRAVAQCAEVGAAGRRHACLDDVLRRAGLLKPEREAQARREDFGRPAEAKSARTVPRVVQPAPPPAPPPAPSPALPAPPAPAGRAPAPANAAGLRTTIRSARIAGNRKLVVVTADGAVWEQTGSEDFHVLPRAGDAFEIQPGTLGSYRCTFGRSSVYRCRRLD